MNAAPHVGLITEAICQRTLNGAAISPNVVVLAALNPYRRRPQNQLEQAPGLVFRGSGAAGADGGAPDPMAALVYRVHPVPATLMDFIFDFGALSREGGRCTCARWSMASSDRAAAARPSALFATLIVEAQAYVREVEGDASAVSLRDVRRALDLLAWFEEHAVPKSKRPRPIAVALALAHVYLYRLGSGTLPRGPVEGAAHGAPRARQAGARPTRRSCARRSATRGSSSRRASRRSSRRCSASGRAGSTSATASR